MALGKLLGRKDKDARYSSETQPSNSSNVADSAYASSEPDSKMSHTNSTERVPVKNEGQFDGVSGDRNLTMNKSTGEVADDETGEVVSTVSHLEKESDRETPKC